MWMINFESCYRIINNKEQMNLQQNKDMILTL